VRLLLEWLQSHILQGKTTEYRRTVQSAITSLINRDLRFECGLVFRRELLKLFYPKSNGIDFNKFDSVGVIHAQRRGQICHDISILRPLHAPIDFVEHDHVGLLHQRDLMEDFFSILTGAGIRRGIYQPGKMSAVSERGPDRVKLDTSLDVPLRDAYER